jgi:hypothetical protein
VEPRYDLFKVFFQVLTHNIFIFQTATAWTIGFNRTERFIFSPSQPQRIWLQPESWHFSVCYPTFQVPS